MVRENVRCVSFTSQFINYVIIPETNDQASVCLFCPFLHKQINM